MAYILGFCSRTGSAAAVAVDVSGTPTLVGRRDVELTDPGTPWQLYHAAAELPPEQAEAMVRAGVTAVTTVAVERLQGLQAELGPAAAVGVVTGDRPVPESVTTILASHALLHAAEGQLYRDALLDAAAECGLNALGLPKGRAGALLAGEYAGAVAALGRAAGRPWRKEHKLAAASAMAAGDT